MNEVNRRGERGRGPSDQELERAAPRGSSTNEFRIGVFVLVGLLSILSVLYLTTDPALFRGRYMLTTSVPDAQGLRRGDPVQMRGVNVGRVHGFAMGVEGVIITLEIEGEWEIPGDSRTRLTTTSLLGGKTVEIVPGESPEPASSGEHLPGASTGDLFGDVSELGGEAQEVLVRIRTLLSEPTVASVQASAREMESLLENLNSIAEEQRAEVDRLVRTLNEAATGAQEITTDPELRRTLARADSAMQSLNRTSETLQSTSESLETVLARIEAGEGTLGQLWASDSLYRKLDATLTSLDDLLLDFRQNPGRYIKLSVF